MTLGIDMSKLFSEMIMVSACTCTCTCTAVHIQMATSFVMYHANQYSGIRTSGETVEIALLRQHVHMLARVECMYNVCTCT